MTNKEYIQAQIGFAPGENVIDAALLDAAITAGDTYITANRVSLKTAAISVLYVLLSTADTQTGVGETAFKTTYDRNAILKRIALLESEVGVEPAGPTIKAVHKW